MPRPLTATIDMGALQHNLAKVRQHGAGASVFAVVKADAYGHGVTRAARALGDADGLALLEIDAAVRLREAGYAKRLALLEGVFEVADLRVAADHDLTIVIHNQQQLRLLDCARSGGRFDVLLKIPKPMPSGCVRASCYTAALRSRMSRRNSWASGR